MKYIPGPVVWYILKPIKIESHGTWLHPDVGTLLLMSILAIHYYILHNRYKINWTVYCEQKCLVPHGAICQCFIFMIVTWLIFMGQRLTHGRNTFYLQHQSEYQTFRSKQEHLFNEQSHQIVRNWQNGTIPVKLSSKVKTEHDNVENHMYWGPCIDKSESKVGGLPFPIPPPYIGMVSMWCLLHGWTRTYWQNHMAGYLIGWPGRGPLAIRS